MARPYKPPAAWKKHLHSHGCRVCHGRYEDACTELLTDRTCGPCRSGIPSVRQRYWGPATCCAENHVMADKYLREQLKLAGPGPWWVCKICARSFAARPEQVVVP